MTISVADYARDCAAQGLRGDYSVCRADFTVAQGYDYSAEEQAVWRTLCDRQTKLTRRLAHRSYLDGVDALGLLDKIPDFEEISDKLRKLTGWEIVAVPGLIPAGPFFDHLASRRFPVTNWLRTQKELDYIVEPDMFHDFFGHVPILTQPVFADFMQMYGQKAEDVIALGGDEMITRLYWYSAEYGLIQEPGQPVKAFGAGLMSSFTELQFAVESKDAHHVPFDLETVMRTGYEIDKFQRAYFVLPSFDVLRDAFASGDLSGIVTRFKDQAALDPATV
ncbi:MULTISPECIES: phenylalanine 4-monooxygenase [unclassified Mesorhizobium]|uniref:phenylalanine 4-monooxygenase n=1 Tax=unclassified Mesorhizobium TaxID=325217 RepID=UPI000BAE8ABF|nr:MULTISPECIES: phenylalanine 4-monooxygenase [unclassified Mesorhizobium]TGT60517.1 phenylalanine 4-monooxygenase [Mesorhizobium sp. M00.F.Ca.ET.170.01.1.1]AZO10380.1 phenylalanine 4-monooxygenase [Mesorhizobium sp. M3A.F.Ca.ET.080.04.2.1]PBB87904.1 phenylalanine 4-monooxygenase [Mesorhizobium sp. WSM3876]RWB73625.1 MAG: phenylalanine 4-monooxygenase [Mesorhizobium sp.]RWB91818.1 MAG: phenylalanine 4-monooxygenase [Mesorhizobium sp.]